MRPGDHGTDPWEGTEHERPIDIEALRADDEFIESLMSGGVQKPTGVRKPDSRSPGDVDAELRSMLSAWVLDVRPETVSAIESIALPAAATAPAELVSAPDPEPVMQPFTAISFRGRNRQPAGYFRRALVAASVVAVVGSGLAVGAYQSEPGGTLWPMTKVLYAEHARSVQAAADVTTSLDRARTALREGRTGEAAAAIREVRATLDQVDPAQGRDALDQIQQELSITLATVDPTAAATLNLPPAPDGARGAAAVAGAPVTLTDRAAESGSAPSVTAAVVPPVVTDPPLPLATAPAPVVLPPVVPATVEPAPAQPSPVEPEAPLPDPATSEASVAPADPATEPQSPAPTTDGSPPTTVDTPAGPTDSGAGTGPTDAGTDTPAPAVATDTGAGPAIADAALVEQNAPATTPGDAAPAADDSLAGSLLATITSAATETAENAAAVTGS